MSTFVHDRKNDPEHEDAHAEDGPAEGEPLRFDMARASGRHRAVTLRPRRESLQPASPEHRLALMELFDQFGEVEALRRVGLSRLAGYRTLGGLPVLAGTRALLSAAFD